MNAELVNIGGFADRDLRGIDQWQTRSESDIAFATIFPTVATVGTPHYSMRWRLVGKECIGQLTFYSSTSVASTAPVDYFLLPVTAGGIVGRADVVDNTGLIAIGQGVVSVSNSRCYLPWFAPTAHVIGVYFSYEVQ